MQSNIKRSLAKTLSWRVLATTTTFIVSWLITGSLKFAGSIAVIEASAKMFLYYGHERGWNKIKWGKDKHDPHTTIWPYKE